MTIGGKTITIMHLYKPHNVLVKAFHRLVPISSGVWKFVLTESNRISHFNISIGFF